MKKAPIHKNEKERLDALHRMAILDTSPEDRFDNITRKAAEKLRVPICAISIIDSDREWYKSCQGTDQKEGPRDSSFCGHALFSKNEFIVEDTLKDDRFADNPAVIGSPFVRSYAGVALLDDKTGMPIGVFCIKDTKPRNFSIQEIATILDFARMAERELNK